MLLKKRLLIEKCQDITPIWMVLLLVLRPKRFLYEYIYSFFDFVKFYKTVKTYIYFCNSSPIESKEHHKKKVLIVAGKAMNTQWNQIWSVFGVTYKQYGYDVYVLTSKSQIVQNLYYKYSRIKLIYIEDLNIDNIILPNLVINKINSLHTFLDFKNFELDSIPYGKMALSTFSRLRATGIMDVDKNETQHEIRLWLQRIFKSYAVAEKIFSQYQIEMLFFTEVFMEEYGAIYYAALKNKLNIIRFAGTVRDDAVVVHHLNSESDRTHFSALSTKSWNDILGLPYSEKINEELLNNFIDRYGEKWALSKRNQPNTKIIPKTEAKRILGIYGNKKVAIIYSHILYDTLFFNGEDIFNNYADWLIQTIKIACANVEVDWYIKIHPSNLWRGELEYFHKGKYEEVRLIEKYIGELPAHVKLIYPDTEINPYTWMYICDFGITVRGTSGIELAALGKNVITAGTGRYEKIGFTTNPKTVEEYTEILSCLPDINPLTEVQIELARRFAYATFCLKPYTLDFFKPTRRTGKQSIKSSDDLVYLGKFSKQTKNVPDSIKRFVSWSLDKSQVDFLNAWPN